MIKTILVEDNMFMQNHFAQMLRNDAFEAEAVCRQNAIDLVVMDVQTLHNHSGLAAGQRIRAATRIKVVIVTSLIDPEILAGAKAGGADSLWYKDHGEAELMDVIRRTLKGEQVFPEASPSVELKSFFSDDISPRQLAILRRFVKGMTYDEIAEELKITKNGVRWNINEIVEKGGFQNKHELLAALIENKLIVTTLEDE